MYIKLSLRNAKRSAGDYLLYITTLIVLSALMMFSNLLASASEQNGLQTSSVPIIISLVMVALLNYIHNYMMRQRAKEFATYILLGMQRSKMAAVFFGESLLLGIIGLFIGMALGGLLFALALAFLQGLFPIAQAMPTTFMSAARDSILYFLAIQATSLIHCVKKMRGMQIKSLMAEGRTNQELEASPRPMLWSIICATSLALDVILTFFIVSGNPTLMLVGVNMIILPLTIGIWAFYKAAFHWLCYLRTQRRSALYRGNRLYFSAQCLSKITSNIALNTTLAVCLLFSILAFAVGFILPNISGELFAKDMTLWLSFSEICLCIVFIAIYFSILAVRQVIEAKENRRAFAIMAHLGKTKRELKHMIRSEILIKYTLPAVTCPLILLLCAGPINSQLNELLIHENLLITAIGLFFCCFTALYAGYATVAYRLSVGRK